MTLYKVIETIKMLALKHPNINSAYEGNIYELMNANPSLKYACFVITQQSHTQDDTYDHYGFNLFYVDRLVDDMEDNRVQIQSTGKSMLSNIIKAFCEEFDAECENINYQTFTERFADECAGVYCTLVIDMVKDIYCTEKYWDESWVTPMVTVRNQNKSVQFTANGIYTIDYDADKYSGLGKVEVEVNVPDLNGSYDEGYTDGKTDGREEGYADGKQDGIEEGYSQGKSDGFNEGKVEGYTEGKEDGISEQKSKLESISISENGTYTREDGYNEIVVEVPDLNGSYDEGYDVGYSEGVEEGTANAGAIIAETAQVLNITENGTYPTQYTKDEDLNSSDNIPPFEGNLIRTVNVNVVPKIKVSDYNVCLAYSRFTEVPEWVDFEGVTNMRYFFTYCDKLTTIPFIDTSKVTDMYGTFANCSSLISVPNLNTSNVTTIESIFSNCKNLTTFPEIDTSNVTTIGYFIQNCTSLTSVPALNAGKVSTTGLLFGSTELPNLTDFGGFIGLKASINNDYGFKKTPNLTYESCINILNGLYDFVGNGVTPSSLQGKLKVHQNFLDKLTEDDKNIAISKGWVLQV